MAAPTKGYFEEALGHFKKGVENTKKVAKDVGNVVVAGVEKVADMTEAGASIAKEKLLDGAPTGPDKVSKESKEAAKAVKENKK